MDKIIAFEESVAHILNTHISLDFCQLISKGSELDFLLFLMMKTKINFLHLSLSMCVGFLKDINKVGFRR